MSSIKIFDLIVTALSWLFGKLKKDPVKSAYKEADEAEGETAIARERVIELEQEQVSDELRDEEIDDIFDDTEY